MLLCGAFIAGLLVMRLFFPEIEEFPYQHQAYADKGFIQLYDSSLRNWLFERAEQGETEALTFLTKELKRVLVGMRARVMYELTVSGKEYEGYNPYYDDSKAFEPDKHDMYMHTKFFERLAKWEMTWGKRSIAEQIKISNIRWQWSLHDNKARELDLTRFYWGSRRSGNYLENIYKHLYTPYKKRHNQIESLITHFEGLTESLETVGPVFIDFARDPDLRILKIIEKTHESDDIQVPYHAAFFKGRHVDIVNHNETAKIISLLRNTTYLPIEKPDNLVEEEFILRGQSFQMHFYDNNIVYIIWYREEMGPMETTYDRGYFKVDQDIMSEVVVLLRELYQ